MCAALRTPSWESDGRVLEHCTAATCTLRMAVKKREVELDICSAMFQEKSFATEYCFEKAYYVVALNWLYSWWYQEWWLALEAVSTPPPNELKKEGLVVKSSNSMQSVSRPNHHHHHQYHGYPDLIKDHLGCKVGLHWGPVISLKFSLNWNWGFKKILEVWSPTSISHLTFGVVIQLIGYCLRWR